MKKLIYTLLTIACVGVGGGCSKGDDAVEQPASLSLSSENPQVVIAEQPLAATISATQTGETYSIRVNASDEWTLAITDFVWFAATKTDANTLTVVVPENKSSQARAISLSLVTESGLTADIRVEQEGKSGPVLDLQMVDEDTEILLNENGGSYVVGVHTTENWTVSTNSIWLQVEKLDDTSFRVTAPYNNTISNLDGMVTVTAGTSLSYTRKTVAVSQPAGVQTMIITLDISEAAANKGSLPFAKTISEEGYVLNCVVDWGDGSVERVVWAYPQHQYAAAGVYDVKIYGIVEAIKSFNSALFPTEYAEEVVAVKQWGNTKLVSLVEAFHGCPNLRYVAKPAEDTFSELITCREMFYSCAKMESIPEGLFAHAPKLQDANGVFQACAGLTAAPAELFAGCSNLTTVFRAFWGCTALNTVGADLLKGCSSLTDAIQMFYNSGIEKITYNLFADCPSLTKIGYTFGSCPKLTEIPEGLFAGKTLLTGSNTYNVFNGCSSLKALPDNLFADCSAMTSLYMAFQNCTSLERIGNNVFKGCVALSDVRSAFLNAAKLTSVPVDIFDDCVVLEKVGKAFSGCTALTGESPYTEIAGVKVHLYERQNHTSVYKKYPKTTSSSSYNSCFTGCTGLSDYDAIPSLWKQ